MAQAKKAADQQPENTQSDASAAADSLPAAKPAAAKEQKQPEPAVYVLEANFGAIVNRVHHFWEAGREFVEKEDAELIAFLHREGAKIKRKV